MWGERSATATLTLFTWHCSTDWNHTRAQHTQHVLSSFSRFSFHKLVIICVNNEDCCWKCNTLLIFLVILGWALTNIRTLTVEYITAAIAYIRCQNLPVINLKVLFKRVPLIGNYFYAPKIKDRGHIVLSCLSFCHSVILSSSLNF